MSPASGVVAFLVGLSLFTWPTQSRAAVTGDWGAYALIASSLAVPLPTAYVHRVAYCPDSGAAACSSPLSDDIWISDRGLDRFTLAHELGHQFDRQYLSAADRSWLRGVMRAPTGEWFRPYGADEWFADYYADCAIRAWRRGVKVHAAYASIPPPTRLVRVCAAITAWGLVRG